jgi:hypothetical protein
MENEKCFSQCPNLTCFRLESREYLRVCNFNLTTVGGTTVATAAAMMAKATVRKPHSADPPITGERHYHSFPQI